MFQVQTISHKADLACISKAWDHLVRSSTCPEPFAAYDWYRCCLSQIVHPLYVLAVWREQELVGIAPWWIREVTRRGVVARQLEFIANQDTPWADLIIHNRYREKALTAIGIHLERASQVRWDVLSLRQWPEDSPNRPWLEAWIKKRSFPYAVRPSSHVPLVRIEGTWEAFLRAKPQRARKTQRNIANRMAKLGQVTVECHREGTVESLMNYVLAVSRCGWKYQEGKSMANRPEIIRFFRQLTDVAIQRSWLMVWILKVNERPIAMEYDLTDGNRIFALRSDFDEAYRDCSPGSYLETRILQWMFAQGWKEYSYGPGLNAYKLHWATGIKTNLALDVFNVTLKGRSLAFLETQLVPIAKRIRDAVQGESSRSASPVVHG